MSYSAVVLHSGGMDSSLCLLLAAQQYGKEKVISLGFRYHQRHSSELEAAAIIARHFDIRREVIEVSPIPGWETSSLISHDLSIQETTKIPNSFVVGRNGLFLMMAAPLAKSIGAHTMFIGVMELEGANSGYPDCSRQYVESVQTVIRHDIQDPAFTIQTPLIHMSKAQTLEVADSLGALDFLLQHTVTCYNGIANTGCQQCPACRLRNAGIAEFYAKRSKKRG